MRPANANTDSPVSRGKTVKYVSYPLTLAENESVIFNGNLPLQFSAYIAFIGNPVRRFTSSSKRIRSK